MKEYLTLCLTSMSQDGRAVGRIERQQPYQGMAVFVENALAGQTVKAEILSKKKNFIVARTVEVLEQSPFAAKGICMHRQECGGCSWQNLKYERQVFEKENLIKNVLRRVGKIENFETCFHPLITPSAVQEGTLFYRTKMEFAFSLQNKRLKLGLRKKNSHDIVEVTDCRLQNPHAMKILALLRTVLKSFQHEFYRYAVLRYFQDKWTVELITYPFSKSNGHNEKQSILACYEALKHTVSGMVHSVRTSKTDVAYGENIVCEYGDPLLFEKLAMPKHTANFKLGNSAFFQVNTAMAEQLYRVIYNFAALVLPKNSAHIWDCYCGVGAIALSLAPLAVENKKEFTLDYMNGISVASPEKSYKKPFVLGVEAVQKAILLAKENALLNQCAFAKFECSAGKELHKFFTRFSLPNLIILDPPRAGVEDEALNAILEYCPQFLILVSCNPATLARDLAKLAETYSVKAIQGVDLFPHTPHVETVVLLEKIYK